MIVITLTVRVTITLRFFSLPSLVVGYRLFTLDV